VLSFLVIAGVGGWLYVQSASRPAKRTGAPVRTAVVRKDIVRRTARISGVTVAGRFSMLLAPALRGTRTSYGSSDFQQILINTATPGSLVKRGDIVAEFERMYMLRRLDDYRSSVIQTEANLRSLYAALDVRRKNYDQLTTRYRGARDKAALDLKKAPALSTIQGEKNRLTHLQYDAQLKEIIAEEQYFLESEKASIRRSELSLSIAKMELERAQRNADSMLVKAPLDGMVVMQTIRRGSDTSEIRGGDQLYPGQPYMQIIDPASIGVMASVNQVDADLIRVGAPARVVFDAYPGLELPAKVVSVGAMAASKGWRGAWVKSIDVRLALQQSDPRVIPNFSVAADIVLEDTGVVPMVPRESIFTDPADGRPVAFVRNPQGWEKRDVELGVVSNTTAEIKAGLNTGETIAAEWPLALPEGAATPR
jgi:multidrug efflux pump subunit AcrA (membrane-fusion protein)